MACRQWKCSPETLAQKSGLGSRNTFHIRSSGCSGKAGRTADPPKAPKSFGVSSLADKHPLQTLAVVKNHFQKLVNTNKHA